MNKVLTQHVLHTMISSYRSQVDLTACNHFPACTTESGHRTVISTVNSNYVITISKTGVTCLLSKQVLDLRGQSLCQLKNSKHSRSNMYVCTSTVFRVTFLCITAFIQTVLKSPYYHIQGFMPSHKQQLTNKFIFLNIFMIILKPMCGWHTRCVILTMIETNCL